jgi:hypothetical protein
MTSEFTNTGCKTSSSNQIIIAFSSLQNSLKLLFFMNHLDSDSAVRLFAQVAYKTWSDSSQPSRALKHKISKQKNAKKFICDDSHGVCESVDWRDTGQKQPNVPPPRVLLRPKNNLNLKKCKRRIRRYHRQSAPKIHPEKTKCPPSHNGIQIYNSQWLLKFSFWYRNTLAASTNVCQIIT